MANSSSLSHQFNYDVFLSFRGKDVRNTFVDHLYPALFQNGISVFMDDNIQESNDSWKSIEESRFAIVIFSKTFASSSFCLDELVKIMECSKQNGMFVLPVYYYDFSPSSLRKHGSVFGELFGKFEMERVRAWTSALVEAANLSGIGLIHYRYQENRVKEIVEIVLSKLNFDNVSFKQNAMEIKHDESRDSTSSREKLVGIEHRMQQVKALLEADTVNSSKTALDSSSPQSSRWTYDVFMCCKRNDTCKDFADQLHCALEQQGIYVLSNNQGLARDELIATEHLKTIEESSIAVVIFSKNYAADSCCLKELVKIMNCNEENGQIVLPIFYDVDPSDVRNLKGQFGQFFMENKLGKVEIWREAIAKACSLAGWYLNGTPKSHEAIVIKSIVDIILRRLVCFPSSVENNLIGIELHIKHVTSLLKLESGGVLMLGIWGMGGIGKTTIARAVFEQVSINFESSYFVENIREVSRKHGIDHIQEDVLSRIFKDNNLHVTSVNEGTNLIKDKLVHHKVLFVLDDVDHNSQLEALAGSHNWFGEGSRIIITTRDENVLVAHNIMQIYYVEALDDNESSQFLRRHAFKKDDHNHAKGYEDLSRQVVSYAAGLPLALKVLSSLLCGKSKKEWKNTVDRLQVFPEKEIQDSLKISFDGLDDNAKELFLHIACFFNDTAKDYVVNILDSCELNGDSGIRLLEQKSLIGINKGHIKMHKLIQQMGRDIVYQVHPNEPGKRSRLWLADEFSDILMDNMGTKEIKAIVVDDMHDQDDVDMTKAFRSMKKLRLLQIRSHDKSMLLQGSNYLPNDLRWLTWENYPLPSLPTSFKGNKLVGLELLRSSISEPWHGYKFMRTLTYLNLSYSMKLIKTPDFTGTPNLKKIKIEHCIKLIEVHESIGYLGRLSSLSLRSCKNLEILPSSFWKLKSLENLDLSGCVSLKPPRLMDYRLQFPSDSRMLKAHARIGNLMYLTELELQLTDLKNLNLPPIHSLMLPRSFILHDLILDIGRKLCAYENSGCSTQLVISGSDRSLLSDSETSEELVEYKKEKVPFLPEKGV